jgi:hypothetical protein
MERIWQCLNYSKMFRESLGAWRAQSLACPNVWMVLNYAHSLLNRLLTPIALLRKIDVVGTRRFQQVRETITAFFTATVLKSP